MPDECQSIPITAPKHWNQKGDDRAEPRHARAQPGRHMAAMQGEISAAAASGHISDP
jgi:hypothetical protein